MSTHPQPTFLLASPDPVLLAAIEPLLLVAGARAEIVLSAEAALSVIGGAHPPDLALLDIDLPGMPVSQLLAAARARADSPRLPIILIADTVTQEWIDRLAEGAVEDLILRSAESTYWQLRLDLVLRNQRIAQELESLRETSLRNAQLDRLTGVYNRETLLAMLFRETDRVQRGKTSMCLVLFDVDDFGHWNSRLGVDACDELLCQVATRTGCAAAQLRFAGPARHGRISGRAKVVFDISLVPPITFKEWKVFAFKAPKRKKYKDIDRQVVTLIQDEQAAQDNHSNKTVSVGDWVCFDITPVNEKHAHLFKHL